MINNKTEPKALEYTNSIVINSDVLFFPLYKILEKKLPGFLPGF